MESFKERIENVKAKISLRVYVEQDLGKPRHSSHGYDSYDCPFCGGSGANPPFSVFEKPDGEFFKCHACDKKGDLITYVMERGNLSTTGEALERLGESPHFEKPVRKQRKQPEEKDYRGIATAAYNRINLALPWLHERKVSDPVAHNNVCGADPRYKHSYQMATGEWVPSYTLRYSIPNMLNGQVRSINWRLDDVTARQTYLDTLEKNIETVDKVRHDIAKHRNIPVMDVTLDMELEALYGPKYKQDGHKYPFNIDRVLRVKDGKPELIALPYLLVLPEIKEVDVLSLESAGYMAVGILPTWPKVDLLLSKVRIPIIIGDNDDTGRQRADAMFAALKRTDAHILFPPEGMKDPNDVCRFGDVHVWLSRYGIKPRERTLDG